MNYRNVNWADVQSGRDIYITEPGRTKPYGPYRVVDPATRMVEEKFPGSVPFAILPHEQIAVEDDLAMTATTMPTNKALVSENEVSSVINFLGQSITLKLASMSTHISTTDQAELMKQSDQAKKDAITALTRILNR